MSVFQIISKLNQLFTVIELPVDGILTVDGLGQFQLVYAENGKTVDVVLKQEGDDLELWLDDEKLLSVEDYYLESSEAEYIPTPDFAEQALVAATTEQTANNGLTNSSESDDSSFDWGLAFGVAVSAGMVGSLIDRNSSRGSSDAADDLDVTVTPMAGPFISDVLVTLYDASGNELGNGSVDEETGQVIINVPDGYSGAMLVVVTDINGEEADYISEATGEETSLNGSLRAMINVNGTGTTSLSVTPLTELAAQLAGVPEDVSELAETPLSDDQVDTNEAIADLFGLTDILGEATSVAEDDFDGADGLSDAEKYGDILAILSGSEDNLGGMAASVAALAAQINLSDSGEAELSSEGASILQSGLQTFEEGVYADKLDSQSIVASMPVIAEADDGIKIEDASDGTEVTLEGVSEGDSVVINLGNARIEYTITLDMLSDGVATLPITADELEEAGEGQLELVVQVNDSEPLQPVEVDLDLTRPEASISIADSMLIAGETSTVTFTFTEAVTGFDLTDVQTSAGSLSELTSEDNIVWTALFTPSANIESAEASIVLTSGFTDLVGNTPVTSLMGDTEVAAQEALSVDTLVPTATLELADTALQVGDETRLTIRFSEPVSGFSLEDIQVTNAEISNLVSNQDGSEWTATLTPVSGVESESNQVSLSTDWVDAAGNAPTVTYSTVNFSVDTIAPTFTSGTVADAIDENSGAGTVVYTVTTDDESAVLSLSGADADYFSFNADTGDVTLVANADYEAKASYSFEITATDAAGNSDSQTVTLAVSDLDEVAPVITSSTTAGSIDENTGAGTLVYTVTTDDTSAVLSLGGTDADYFSFNADTGEVTLLADADFEAKSSYSFEITATDAAGNSDSQTVTLAVNNLDEATPVFTSGTVADAIDENTGAGTVVYIATVDDSADVSSGVTLSLAGTDADYFSFNAETGEVTLLADADFESKSSYSFEITATDDAGNSDKQTVTLAVNDLDEVAPVFTSGTVADAIDENSGAGSVVYTVNTDDESAVLSLGGTDADYFSFNAETGEVTLLADADYEAKASYSFEITATDAAGNSDSQTVTLAVNDLDEVAPVITSSTAAGFIDENTGAGNLVYTVTTDDASAVLSLGGTDADYFSFNADTGEVTLLADADYEAKSSYSFEVTATDAAGNSDSQTVTLAVNNLDEAAPVFTSPVVADAIDENTGAGTVVYIATVDDSADVSSGVTLSLAGTDADYFSFNAETGEVTLLADADYEAKSSYSFEITATDDAGNSDKQTVTLAVNDLDEVAPVFTSGTVADAIDENSGAGTVVYTVTTDDQSAVLSLSGADADYFSFNADTGDVTLLANADYEAKASYSFEITATDAAGNSDSQTVTLAVSDLDEVAPVITSSTTADAIDENTGAGTLVYTVTTDDTSAVLSLGGVDADYFSFNADTGEVTLLADADYEAKSSYSFEVTATDAAGNSDKQTVTLAVNNLDEAAPVFTSGTTADGIDENSGAGVVIYNASVDDSADIASGMTFTLGGTDADLFSINASTGAVTLRENADFEAKSSYSFDVIATDGAGLFSSQAVTLPVVNVDDTAPVITSALTNYVGENYNAGAGALLIRASDDTDVTFSITGGADADAFGIYNYTDYAILSINESPDYETQSSYQVQVTATDEVGLTTTVTLTLDIRNRDEVAPTFTSATVADAIDENTGAGTVVYIATANDDGDMSEGFTLSFGGTDADFFSFNADTGEVTLLANADYEAKSSYSFEVTATDAAGNSDKQTVTLAVNNLDEAAPVFTSPVVADAINENAGAGTVVYIATVDDSADVSSGVTLSLAGTDADYFSFNAETGEVTLLADADYETKSSYSFEITATDDAGNSDKQTVTLAVNDLDEVAPVFTSGTVAEAIDENTGAGSVVYTVNTDDESAVLSLGGTDANYFSFNADTGEVTLLADADYEAKASYSFEVTATDVAGNSDSQTVTLAVNDLDEVAPVFPLVVDSFTTSDTLTVSYTVVEIEVELVAGITYYIDQYGSSTGDGSMAYPWVRGMSDPSGNSVYLTTRASAYGSGYSRVEYTPSVSGTYTVKAGGNSDSKGSFTLKVTPISEGINTNQVEVDENISTDTVIYTADATDTDGQTDTTSELTYTLSGDDADYFTIDYNTGELRFAASPDFEAQSSYQPVVIATDTGGNSASQTIVVTLNNLDEAAPVFTSEAEISIDEDTELGDWVYYAEVDDSADTSDGVTFSLSGADADLFEMDEWGDVYTNAEFDYETRSSYSIDITATDAAGNSTKQTVTVNINNVDEVAPVFTSGTEAISVDENSGAGTVVYTATVDDSGDVSEGVYLSLSGRDASSFSLNRNTGEVTLRHNTNYEAKSSYEFTIRATDDSNNYTDQIVTLVVNNLDDTAPVFTSGTEATAIDENSGAGTVVYTAVVDDSADVSDGVTLTLGGTDADYFSFNADSGEVTLLADADYEAKSSYSFEITATDAAGNLDSQTVTLAVNNLDESAPVFTSGTEATAINENTGAGTVVYTAMVDDSADVSAGVTLSLAGSDADYFSLNAETGEVTLLANADYEAKSSYSFEITATDSAGNSDFQTVTLAVNNLDEVAPAFTSGTEANAIDENSGAGTVVYTARVDDSADVSAGVTLSLGGADADYFSFNAATGEVTLLADADYEAKSSYSFEITATDVAGNSDSQIVTLAVNNLDEVAPVFTSATDGVALDAEAVAGTVVYTALTNDSGDISDGYQLSFGGTDADYFSFDAETGAVTLLADVDSEAKASYEFSITATDTAGNSTTRTIKLAVDTQAPEVAIEYAESEAVIAWDGSTPERPADASGRAYYTHGVHALGADEYVLVTHSENGNDVGLFMQAVDSTGQTSGTAVSLDTPDYEYLYIDQVISTDGNLVVLMIVAGEVEIEIDGTTEVARVVRHVVSTFDSSGNLLNSLTLTPPDLNALSDFDADITRVGDEGDFVVTWVSETEDSVAIVTQRFNSSGVALGEAVNVITDDESEFEDSGVTDLGSGGGYVVSWIAYAGNDETSISFQLFDADGNPQGEVTQVPATDIGYGTPAISSVSDEGNFVLAWFGDDSVVALLYDASGNALSEPVSISAPEIHTDRLSDLSITEIGTDGAFVMTWVSQQEGDSADTYAVFAQTFDSSGAATGDVIALTGDGVAEGWKGQISAIALGDSGAFVVVWTETDSDGDDSVFVQYFNSQGEASGNATKLEYPGVTDDGDFEPTVTALGDTGTFLVSWVGLDENGTEQVAIRVGTPEVDLANVVQPGSAVQLNASEAGTLYLVDSSVVVAAAADITAADDSLWSSLEVAEAGRAQLDTEGLADGTYFAYMVDNAGNLSLSSVQSIVIDGTAPVISTIAEVTSVTENQALSEAVYSFTIDDTEATLTLAGEDADYFELNAETGEVFLTVTPDYETQSSYSIDVVATDSAGNQTTQPLTLAVNDVDEIAPEITSTSALIEDYDGERGFIVTWASEGDILAQRYDSEGNTVGDEFQVNSGSYTTSYRSAVTYFDDGGFLITWDSVDVDGNREVYGQRFDADGNTVGDEFQVNTYTTMGQYNSSITTFNDGSFVVVWQSSRQDYSNYGSGIYGQRYDSEGNAVGDEFLINTTTVNDQGRPDVVGLSNGGFVVVWYSWEDTDSSEVDVYAQLYDASGNEVGSEFQVNTDTGRKSPHHVAALENGGFVVTWQSFYGQDGYGSGVYAQRYDAEGMPVGDETLVNTTTNLYEGYPAITGLEGGGYVITWRSYSSGASTYDQTLMGQIYDADGNTVGGEFEIAFVESGTADMAITALSGGGFLVTWEEDNNELEGTGDGDGYGVFGLRFDADGTAIGDIFQINTTTSGDQRYSATAALLEDAGNLASIDENSGAGSVVFTVTASDNESTDAITLTLAGDDADLFDLNTETGDITLLADTDYEADAIYSLEVIATDAAGNSTSQHLTLLVNNQDEVAPILTSAAEAGAIDENTGAGTVVYTATFDDSSDVSGGVTLSLGGADADNFSFDAETGAVTLLADADYEAKSSYSFEITATDAAGHSDSQTVTLAVNDLDDEAPVFTSGTSADAIDENSGAGILVYTAATDDTEATLSLSGTDAALFSFNAETGEVTLLADADHETKASYEFTVIATDAAGNESRQTVTMAVNDLDESAPEFSLVSGFVVTWMSQDQDGDGVGIYAQRYDANGNAVGDEFLVNSTTASNQKEPSVVGLADGGFVVVWQSAAQDSDGWGVYAQRYDNTGTTVGDEFLVNTYVTGSQMNPTLTALSDGGFVITWQSSTQDSEGTASVYGQRYDSDGNTLGSEFQINSTVAAGQYLASVAELADGGFVVTWTSENQDGNDDGIFAQRFDSDSNPVGDEFQVNTRTYSAQYYSSITALNGGGFVITWVSWAQSGDHWQVIARQFDAEGNAVTSEIVVNRAYDSGNQSNQSTVALDDGGYVIIWKSNGEDGSGYAVIGKRYDADGNALGNQFQINTYTNSNQNTPAVSTLPDGGFIVTWESFGQDGSDYGIYGQRFDSEGNAVGDEFQISSYTTGAQTGSAVAELVESSVTEVITTASVKVNENFSTDTVIYTAQATDTADIDDDTNTNSELTYSLAGTDAEAFGIDSVTGEVRFAASLDHESQSSYQVEIVATDGSGNSASQTLTVTLNDQDESAPELTVTTPLSGFSDVTQISIDENSGADTVIYTVSATDTADVDDATETSEGVTLTLEGDDAGLFSFNASTGEISLLADADYETQSSYSVVVVATDAAGNEARETLTLNVNNLDESAPVFTSATVAAAIDENTGAGRVVYTAVVDDSADISGGVVYSLSGTDADQFSIDAETGAVTLLANADHETRNSYEFVVTATDAAGNSSPQTVTLAVNDVDESAPDFSATNPGFVVFWHSQYQDGNGFGVFGQRYDANGVAVGDEFQVNTYVTSDQAWPAVTYLTNGGFVVTWDSRDQDGSSVGIYGQLFDANGNKTGDEFKVNTYTTSDQANSAVAALTDGSFVVVWQSTNQDGSYLGVFGQLYDAEGNSVGNEFLVNTYTNDYQFVPQVVGLNDGGFVVVWDSKAIDGSDWGISAQRYDADGNPVGGEFQVNTYSSGYQSIADVTSLSDGGFVVTWHSDGQDGSVWGIYAQRYDADGNSVGSEFRVNSTTSGYQGYPAITGLDDGGFVVTWRSYSSYGGGSSETVYGQRYDADGNAVGGQFQIAYVASGTADMDVTALVDGGFLVTWEENGTDGSGQGVYGQRYDSDGNTVGDTFLVNSYTANEQYGPTAVQLMNSVTVAEFLSTDEVIYTVQATDTADSDDDTDTSAELTYSLAGTDADAFNIDADTGEIRFVDSPVYNNQSSYELTLIATDLAGNSASQTLKILIDDTTAPVFTSTTTADIDENSGAGSVIYTAATDDEYATYSISGTDADQFSIDAVTGAVTLLADADHETQSSYEFTITATDTAGNESSQTVTLAVNDVDESAPEFTATANGYVVAWHSQYQDGSGYGVYAQRYDTEGNAVGSEFKVNSYTSSDQAWPSVTYLEKGGFVISWNSSGEDGSASGVYAQMYDADGNAVGSEFRVNSYTSNDQQRSSITALLDGGFVVTWHSYGQDGSYNGIYGQRYDADGNAVGSEFRANTYTTYSQNDSEVTALADGGFLISWESANQDGSAAGVYAQRYDADGNTVGSEFRINTTTANGQSLPAAALLEDGSLVITWQSQYQDGSGWGIYAQRYDADGNAIDGEFLINSYTSGDQAEPSITALSGGGFAVIWQSNGQDGSDLGVYGQVYDADGNKVGSEFRVNTYTSYGQGYTSVVSTSDGGFVVTWQSNYEDGSSWGVYGRMYDAEGNAVGSEFLINTYTSNDQSRQAVSEIYSTDVEMTVAEFISTSEVIYTAQATDTADSDDDTVTSSALTYSLAGTDADAFSIDADTGEIRFIDSPVYNNQSSYELTLIATDLAGNSARQTLTILIDDTTAPVFTSAVTAEAIDENSGAGSVVYTATTDDTEATLSFSGTDAALFSFNAETGEVTLLADADHETQSSYEFTITATDTAGNESSQTVTLAVNDVDESAPEFTTTANGYVVAWHSASQDGSGYGVYAQMYDTDGNTIGSEIQVNTYTSDTQAWPGVSYLTNGGFVVTWASGGQDGSYDGIYMQLFDADGNKVGSETLVNTTTSSDQDRPEITSLADGGFVVTWISDQSGSYDIYAQRYDADGSAIASEFLVNTYTANDQTIPSVAALSDGGFVVSWQSYGQAGSYNEVYVQRYDADGNPVGTEQRVNTSTTDNQGNAEIAGLAGGGFVVVWQDPTGTGWDIYAQRYDADGNALGSNLVVNSYVADRQFNPTITALSNGGFVVAWNSDNLDGSGTCIQGQLFDADGNTVGSAFLINSYSTGDQITATITALDDGGFVVSWESPDQDGSGTGVYGQRFDSSANAVGDEFQVNSYTTGDQAGAAVSSLLNSLTVDENLSTDTVIFTAQATDTADADDDTDASAELTYSLAGTDAEAFSIDEETGEVRFAASPDYETQSSYEIDIVATDTGGNSATQGLTVTLNDLDESGTKVLIDFVNGVSSLDADGDRTFDADSTYTIYMLVDSDSVDMNMAVSQYWSSAENLGEDDTIVLVGNGSAVIGWEGDAVSTVISPDYFQWVGGEATEWDENEWTSPALELSYSSLTLERFYGGESTYASWLTSDSGKVSRTVNADVSIDEVYLTELPTSVEDQLNWG